jgi:hypothetical protein
MSKDDSKINDRNKYSTYTEVLNKISILSLVIGISLLIVFSYINIEYKAQPREYDKILIKGESNMAESKKEEKGTVPPPISEVISNRNQRSDGLVPPEPSEIGGDSGQSGSDNSTKKEN